MRCVARVTLAWSVGASDACSLRRGRRRKKKREAKKEEEGGGVSAAGFECRFSIRDLIEV